MVLLPHLARRPTIAIDLGTAFVRVGTPAQPLAVERSMWTGAGVPAAMVGGMVNDIDAAADAIAVALHDARVLRTRRAHVLVSVPGTASSVERAGVRWAMCAAGISSEVVLIEEPLAAAVGLGLDIAGSHPHLVVDVGHGITEAAVIADGAIQAIAAARLGCAELGDRCLAPRVLDVIGRTAVAALLDAGPDLAASIDEFHLVGGGSLIPDVATCLASATGVPVRLAPERFHAVAMGDAACAAETFRRRPGYRSRSAAHRFRA